MPTRNTTLNLPESLIVRAKAYAAAQGTTMTAIVRAHLEAVTAEPERLAGGPLQDYAEGIIGRDEAIRRADVRDYAALLVALGDAGLVPPRPSEHEVENEAITFARIFASA